VCCVADPDRHVGIGEFVREAPGGGGVELERDEPLDAMAKPARRGARARPDLEHLITEIKTSGHRLEHFGFHELGPLRRAAKSVVLIHQDQH
jgi:hypothetical protein